MELGNCRSSFPRRPPSALRLDALRVKALSHKEIGQCASSQGLMSLAAQLVGHVTTHVGGTYSGSAILDGRRLPCTLSRCRPASAMPDNVPIARTICIQLTKQRSQIDAVALKLGPRTMPAGDSTLMTVDSFVRPNATVRSGSTMDNGSGENLKANAAFDIADRGIKLVNA